MVVTCLSFQEAELLRRPRGNQPAGIDDLQHLRIIATLEAERLVVGAVDVDDLASVQSDSNLGSRRPLSSSRL